MVQGHAFDGAFAGRAEGQKIEQRPEHDASVNREVVRAIAPRPSSFTIARVLPPFAAASAASLAASFG